MRNRVNTDRVRSSLLAATLSDVYFNNVSVEKKPINSKWLQMKHCIISCWETPLTWGIKLDIGLYRNTHKLTGSEGNEWSMQRNPLVTSSKISTCATVISVKVYVCIPKSVTH